MKWLYLLLAMLVGSCNAALADPTSDALDAFDRRLRVVEQLVLPPALPPTPATQPATQPTTRPAVEALGLVRAGTVENKIVRTVRKGEIGVQVIGDGVTLRNLEFAPGGGYLCQINNRGVTVDGFTATTFSDYAIYVQGAKDCIVRRMNVTGGSTHESILRLDNVENFTLEASTLDYRPVTPRKAVVRGFGKNIVLKGSTFYGGGASFGLTPMTGFDAGEAYLAGGMLRIRQAPWIITVENRPEWEAMVRALVASGYEDHEAILREVLKRVPISVRLAGELVTLEPSKVDVALTISERSRYLAQRADATIIDCDLIDAPIRNSAGGVQRYIDCTITAAGEPFVGWNEPTYPNPPFLLPGDIKRPAPVTEFTRCTFRSVTWTQTQFLAFCRNNDIRLNGCTFNGAVLPETAQQ